MNRTPCTRADGARSARGFTLLEMLVAMAVGAMVILSARVTVEQLTLGAGRVITAHRRTDATIGSNRWLRGLLRRAGAVTEADTSAFYGDEVSARFSSWCDAPGGWQEACHTRLVISHPDSEFVLSVWTATSGAVVARRSRSAMALRYLAPSDTGISLVEHWGHAVLPPAGVAIVGLDTLIFRIGRGQ